MNRIISSCIHSFIFLWVFGCNPGNADVIDQQHSVEQIPVFDVAMQGVNPDWFVRAMEGVDFGIHRVERYGELVADSSELIRRSLAGMDRNGVRFGLLSHGAHKEAWHAAHPERFLLSFEPDLSLEDHTAAAEEFAQGVREGRYTALGELGLVYAGIPLNTPDLFPYNEAAQELGIPVFIHTGFSGPDPQRILSPAFRIGTADPLLLEDVVIGRSLNMIRNADYLTVDDKHTILWANAARLLRVEEPCRNL